ncbi:MAG: ABC transporter permease [Spirochaetota bacterium]
MMYFKLALLNLWKYRKRTLVVLAGIVLSVVVMQVVGGMLSGMRDTFFSEILRGSGHVQYHAAGWENRLDRFSTEYMIRSPGEITQELRSYDETTRVEAILSFGALLSNGAEDIALQGHGVAPETTYFPDATENVVAGAFLPEGSSGIAISKPNAELLDLALGDSAIVLVQTTLGSPWYLTYPITGIYESGHAELDENVFFISHADAEELLFAEGQTNEIRVSVRDPEAAEHFIAKTEDLAQTYELVSESWREIHGSILVFVEMGDLMSAIINAFVVIVAASVITNAILMTAFDRIPSFGALRAIGMKRWQLLGMIVSEGTVMGIIGSAIGLAIGIPIVVHFQENGLDIGAMSEMLGTGQTYYFSFSPLAGARDFVYGVLIAALSALYVGWATARLDLIGSLQEG